MTVARERIQALENTRQFLLDLLDRSKTKRIPSEIRKQAYWCLRHFPQDYDVIVRPDFPTKEELKALKILNKVKD